MAVRFNSTEKLIREILDLVECRDELKDSARTLGCHLSLIFNECLEECFNYKELLSNKSILKIDSIIDAIDDAINIGHWSDISVELRRVFTLASFVKTLFYLRSHKTNMKIENLREALQYVDRGLLMGAPFEINSELLTKVAEMLTTHIRKYFNENIGPLYEEAAVKTDSCNHKFLFENIKACEVDSLVLPSLEQFNRLYFETQHPVKLQGCIDHWPAKKKWKDLQYLLQIGGDRTVPVEIGTQYVDENWSQRLMTIREFVEKYYFKNEGEMTGYIAQHNLFDQIPELREDICIPEYCSLSKDYDKSCDPEINCWFGPAGTVSSLHHDPKNNFLVQVYGMKQILLFAPQDTQYLYPFEGSLLSNTSQVDPLIPNLEIYPNFIHSKMFKCLLKEGEMLFIPQKWWHYVVALDKSFSVSFWWQ
ncbi:bifunctional peptidase and arginyl-hydroxylase JMJD5-like [Coccinella septempunctata]|uniref:bifunctional peptidase and arginyl-hydroxylase JMJD5-like n=1 Tax=Coccinella septempunctata TaxID=41139 RepID=UPI001D079E17|nr:bifunctional peptidase and arginyl-hydroxylase JMJD5-like [Coccinella septempunctata]